MKEKMRVVGEMPIKRARYKSIDAAAFKFKNAFEQRYFPVGLLILFHSALIFRPYSMRSRSDP